MKYFAMVLRVLIILVGFKMMSISGWTPQTAPFCSGIGFILIGLYLAIQAAIGPKAMLCPLFSKCREKGSCKSEKK
ncbi:MAG: hypothetical protein Q9M94_00725 [Candidatus Gracilibacteria bacterium]|nr:hypothetical protein [Candidatus Gracilibacteria bacterium]MDQ7022338.1 hypothetical protein [Candidatus Gracilibacteria bacterium]